MTNFIKYLKGYLRVKVTGFSPERFMNLCCNNGILLWNIVRENDGYILNIDLSGFWRLRPFVKKTGTRVVILSRYGLPFLLPNIWKRKIFLLGFLLVLLFWFVSSGFIWSIKLEGNIRLTEDVLIKYLKQHNISVGSYKKELKIEQLEKDFRNDFSYITWVSVKIDGTQLVVDIKENDAPILIAYQQNDVGTDLVCPYSGTIVSILVRSGIPCVKKGDMVEMGSVLVSGSVPVYNEDSSIKEYIYVDSDADIILRHELNYSDTLPIEYVQKEYSGRVKRKKYLRINDKKYGLFEDTYLQCDSVVKESRPLLLERLSIPIYFGVCMYREYYNVEHRYSQMEAQKLLNDKLITFLSSLEEKGVQIIEKDVKITMCEETYELNGCFLVDETLERNSMTEKTEVERSDNDGGIFIEDRYAN